MKEQHCVMQRVLGTQVLCVSISDSKLGVNRMEYWKYFQFPLKTHSNGIVITRNFFLYRKVSPITRTYSIARVQQQHQINRKGKEECNGVIFISIYCLYSLTLASIVSPGIYLKRNIPVINKRQMQDMKISQRCLRGVPSCGL